MRAILLMTPKTTLNFLRTLFVVFTASIGSMIGASIAENAWLGFAAGLAFGLLVVLVDRLLKGVSLRVFSSASFGLLVGFIFARLLLASNVLRGASEETVWIVSLVVYATAAYLGMMLAVRSNRDEFSLIIPYVRFRQATTQDEPLVVDSNVIIEGRLPELCATGFVSSSLIVPRFVLDELQRLADSHDPLKRERGRAALERLERMQCTTGLSVTIHESDGEPTLPVDTKLVQTAQRLDARLLTKDTGLCAIARLQGVRVLNLQDVARALRPVIEPGHQLDLALVREGRDAHQAVGYLEDGTMIVINHARAFLGKTVPITVTTSLLTGSGRLFFGELRQATPAAHADAA